MAATPVGTALSDKGFCLKGRYGEPQKTVDQIGMLILGCTH